MSNVVILAASTGKNVELANTLAATVREQGAEAEIVDVVALDLPLYSTTAEGGGIPAAAAEISAKLRASRALIVVAPEYNGAMPPALVNVIAWISRSGDEDWRAAFNAKITAIATFSGGGGGFVLAAMRAQLSFLGANVLGRQLLANYQKPLNEDSATAVVAQLLALSAPA
jgi:chromate reductase